MSKLKQRFKAAVKLSELTELTDNPRRGDVSLLQESVSEIGFYGAVIVNEREGCETTGQVLAGNHRIKAAAALGEDSVPVLYVDVDDVTARKIALVDNHANDRATYDVHDLLATIEKLDGDFLGTGYTEQDYSDLLAQTSAPAPAPYDDDLGDAAPSDDSDYWPSINVKIPPGVFAAWGSLCAKHNDDAEAFTFLMEKYAGVDLTDDSAVDDALAGWDD